MEVHSPSLHTNLIQQSFDHLSGLMKEIGPTGLFWYQDAQLIQSFYYEEDTLSLFLEEKKMSVFDCAFDYLTSHSSLAHAETSNKAGTFVAVVLKNGFPFVENLLQAFLSHLTILSIKNETTPQTYHQNEVKLDLKEILFYLLHKTNYFNKIDVSLVHFVDYLSNQFHGETALFQLDRKKKQFEFVYGTDEASGQTYKKAYLSLKTVAGQVTTIQPFKAAELLPLFNEGKEPFSGLAASDESNYLLIPVKGRLYYIAIILLKTGRSLSDHEVETLNEVIDHISKLLGQIQNYAQIINNGKRYKQLYSVTTKFHSSMDQQEILEEVVHSIVRLYPECSVKLVVSDSGLDPLRKEPLAMEAFVKGELRVDHEDNRKTSIYAPLNGRQGVYGVFIIQTPENVFYEEDELSFIQLQATTAGHALENAKLYQQSQRSISDLQLINQVSERMNSQLRISETIPYLIQQIKDSFSAEEVGFYNLEGGSRWEAYVSSTPFFHTERSLGLVEQLNSQIIKMGEALFLGDMAAEADWDDFEFRSLMAIPMIQDGHLFGIVVALHHNPYQFTFDGFKVMQAIVHHSTLAVINARLREELERLVITDQLTKLYNRSYLNDRIQRSFKEDRSGVLLLIDLDNFKQVNDRHGHLVGDQVLIQVAQLIQSGTREQDISARWGGEELAVYLPNVTTNEAVPIASRLVQKIATKSSPKVTISCGLSCWENSFSEKNHDKLFLQADEALYEAKNSGKNRVVIAQVQKEPVEINKASTIR